MFRFILFFVSFSMFGQKLHHFNLPIQSNSKITSRGYFISQTIGQQSTSGSFYNEKFGVQQGFQQSLFSLLNTKTTMKIHNIKVFPNPFVSEITIEFLYDITGEVEINFFDSSGRLVQKFNKTPSANRVTLYPLDNLAEGYYIVSVNSQGYIFSSQILKIN